MSIERSIDFAKTASIDMMALNNKVVNMRQTVKRSKVQVINKLTKTISKLKKKRGTDEQRQQNVKKAERLIEEIDSIKKLKPDKVSKYALANTATFNDVSKVSVMPGPRALARLADHPLMSKLVSDFRKEHTDWRDLSAYLLVKQTGRRFKTKKQKQQKLSHSVENINASETMTKAYIQSRFGQEGLQKAEQKFERRRKRKKLMSEPVDEEGSVQNEEDNDGREVGKMEEDEEKESRNVVAKKMKVVEEEGSLTAGTGEQDILEKKDESKSVHENVFSSQPNSKMESKNVDTDDSDTSEEEVKGERNVKNRDDTASGSESSSSESESETMIRKSSKSESVKKNLSAPNVPESESRSEEVSGSESEEGSDESEIKEESSKSEAKDVPLEKSEVRVSRAECVVKEFNLESGIVDADSDSGSEYVRGGVQNSSEGSQRRKELKKKSRKEKKVPEFLLKEGSGVVKEVSKDPFFVGSDDEDDTSGFNDNIEDSDPDVKDLMDEEEFDGRGRSTTSMFHNPFANEDEAEESHRDGGSRFARSGRGRGQWGQRRGGEHRGGGRRWGVAERGRGREGRGWGRMDGRGRGGGRGGRARGGGFSSSDRPWTTDRSQSTRSFGQPNPSKVVDVAVETKTEKLHPSWEASKKRKAQQSGLMPYQGKKITFDDDD